MTKIFNEIRVCIKNGDFVKSLTDLREHLDYDIEFVFINQRLDYGEYALSRGQISKSLVNDCIVCKPFTHKTFLEMLRLTDLSNHNIISYIKNPDVVVFSFDNYSKYIQYKKVVPSILCKLSFNMYNPNPFKFTLQEKKKYFSDFATILNECTNKTNFISQ